MSTTAKACLVFLTRVILLLILVWLSPFCFYKMDYAGGYVLCGSSFKETPPKITKRRVEFSPTYNNCNDLRIKLTYPPVMFEKDVVPLSEENFSHVIANNRHVMVIFYAPWCYWSKKLAPEYAAAATQLKGKVVLAKFYYFDKEIELAKNWTIQEYPMYFFVEGVHVDTYYYDSNRDSIVNWIKTRIAVSVHTVMSTEQAENLSLADSTIVLGFLHSLKALETEEIAAASKLHPDVTFYQTASADVAKMLQIDPDIKRPALVLLEKESKRLSHFDGPFTKSAISDFVSVNKHPLVITFTRKTAPLIQNFPLKQLWLFSLIHDSEVKSIFREAAEAFKGKLLFVYVKMDCQNGGRGISDYFGITGHEPRVIAVTDILYSKKYVLNGELTVSTIKSFALNFLEDKFWNQSSTTLLDTHFQYDSELDKF
ncbi:Protein disulfide-isomerase [Melia azedarach]|uniref:Protein disulfide-isomerase n=1 Tax=Melia azedarach TaxID=155640 RepID=A0ACC1YBH8_MELAZ|nr:Protein disulfide-isomerase [Melia azedarach]